jgi:Cu-Zn family superoxide dismutase
MEDKTMIRRIAMLAVLGASLLALSAGIAVGHGGEARAAKAILRDAGGNRVGVVKLNESGRGVRVRVEVQGLSPGFHGFHVHTIGECIAPFTSAMGHFNPTGAGHPAHAADMPVLLVNADGTGEATFVSDRYRVADVLGRALIVHAGADNYANIPTRYVAVPDATTLATGDAGARTACGLIQRGSGRD